MYLSAREMQMNTGKCFKSFHKIFIEHSETQKKKFKKDKKKQGD